MYTLYTHIILHVFQHGRNRLYIEQLLKTDLVDGKFCRFYLLIKEHIIIGFNSEMSQQIQSMDYQSFR